MIIKYLRSIIIRKTCKIFDCNKSTLQRWIQIYKTNKNLTRKNKKPISYKIHKEQVKSAVNMIDKNEQLTMDELLFDMKLNHSHPFHPTT